MGFHPCTNSPAAKTDELWSWLEGKVTLRNDAKEGGSCHWLLLVMICGKWEGEDKILQVGLHSESSFLRIALPSSSWYNLWKGQKWVWDSEKPKKTLKFLFTFFFLPSDYLKTNLPFRQFLQIRRNSSQLNDDIREANVMEKLFHSRDYPGDLIHSARRKVSEISHKELFKDKVVISRRKHKV